MKKFIKFLHRFSLLIILTLTVCGIIFRLFYLDRGLSYNELYTAAASWPGFTFSFLYKEVWLLDPNPPLYNILLFFWNQTFHFPTELWLRLPSVLASLATLYLVSFHTPRYLNKTSRVALIALFATSFGAIFYAQEASCYSLLVLWAVWTLFETVGFAERLQQHRFPSAGKLFLYFTAGIAACYLHYFGAIWFFSLALVLAGYSFVFKQKRFIFYAGPLFVLLCFAPWLHHAAGLTGPFEMWWPTAGFSLTRLLFANGWAAFAAAAVLVISVISAFRTERTLFHAPQIIISSGALLVFFFLVFFCSSQINLTPGSFLVLLPAIYLIGVTFFGSLVKSDTWTTVCLPVVLLLSMCLTTTPYAFGLKKGFNGTKRAMRATSKNLPESALLIYLHSFDSPSPALEKMFAYYPEYYNMDKSPLPLTQNTLDDSFARQGRALIFVPNCNAAVLKDMADAYALFLNEVNLYADVCVTVATPTGSKTPKAPAGNMDTL